MSPTNTSSGQSVGDVRRIQVTTTSTDGTVADADVTLEWRTPSGVLTTIVSTSTNTASASLPSTKPIRASTGVYYADILSTEPGDYRYDWTSTLAVHASTSGRWAVRPKETST